MRFFNFLIFCFLLIFAFSQYQSYVFQVYANSADVSITVQFPDCSDGADNDSDGATDYPNDSGCESASDNNEADEIAPYCGDGACNGSETCRICSSDCGSCSGAGGGTGGSAEYPAPAASVIFSGRAHPESEIILLKDAQISATTFAETNGDFTITLSGLSAGSYLFSLYSKDKQTRISPPATFPIVVTSGAITNITGIVIAPAIITEKSQFNKGDLNNDNQVNLIDFSVLIYWFDRAGFPSRIDLNHDGKINLFDFSIMAYYWTG